MKPQRFEIGQAVTHKEPGTLKFTQGNKEPAQTINGHDIYHVRDYPIGSKYDWLYPGVVWVRLIERGDYDLYNQDDLAPVISNKELAEALSEIATQEPILV